jgi:hypothetical protein
MTLFTILFLVWSTLPVMSQKEDKVISHYLFPSFSIGNIKLKTGLSKDIMLNYNSLTEEMIFESNGKKLALANPESVDTISIWGKKFIPAGKVFYEILEALPVSLYAHHLCRLTPPGKPSGYGGTSETSSIKSTSTIYLSGGVYEMKLPEDYKIEAYSEFILKKGNEYFKAYNAKQVIKCFPGKKDAIKEFIKMNKTSFKKEEDVRSLIKFCNR